jgi:phosphotriesterase-related protein
LVECSTVGVGRRADIDKAVSEATNLPILVPTGVYREPWLLPLMHEDTEDALYEWMRGELEGQIEHSGVQAGWIKLSAGDDGITVTEAQVLRAAARAASRVNAVIGSHTIRGRVVKDQLDIIEAAGYTPDRFIWIHTQAEPDFSLHLEMGRRGAWLEYDSIGTQADEWFIEHILKLLEAGLGNQLLLSHDRGWYDPAAPGQHLEPYTHLVDVLLPKLQAHGVDQATIRQLTQTNPFRAFARN